MAYIVQDIYKGVLEDLQKKLPLSPKSKSQFINTVRSKLSDLKGYQRIRRQQQPITEQYEPQQFPLQQSQKPQPQPQPQPQAPPQIDSQNQSQQWQGHHNQPQKKQQQPPPAVEESDSPLLTHSSSESEKYEIMEEEVKMGIYGNLQKISKTKSKTITLRLEDVLVKNQTHQIMLKAVNARLDIVLTADIRTLK